MINPESVVFPGFYFLLLLKLLAINYTKYKY